jgi:hypothetical protein
VSSIAAAASRQHAYTESVAPQLPEPNYAERARTLVSLTSFAALSTQSRKQPGFPFGSLMPYALDSEARPIFLISNMAIHTQNLKGDSRASLFIGQIVPDEDPLGAARATLVGRTEPVPKSEIASARSSTLHGIRTVDTGWTSQTSASFGYSQSMCTTSADSG